MNVCKYCLTRYDNSFTACPNCGGTKIMTEQELAEEASYTRREAEYRKKAFAEIKASRKKLISALIAVVVIIIAAIAIVSYNTNKPLSNGMTKDECEEILAIGIAYYDAGDYESAIAYFVQLPSDSKQYEEVQSMLQKSEDAYCAGVLEKADSYVQNKEYEMALELLRNALAVLPGSENLRHAYDGIYATYKSIICTAAISEADNYAADGDYESAIKTLNDAIDKVKTDDELSAKLSIYENEYRETVLTKADVALHSDGYQEAISVLNLGLNILVNDSKILSTIEKYRTYTPASLSSFKNYAGSMTIDMLTNCEDCNGYTYSEGYYGAWGGCYGKYLLDYQYAQLTCKYVILDIDNIEYLLCNDMILIIYGDDTVLYSGSLEVEETESLSIQIDVSNVKWLKIYLDCYYCEPLASLVDVQLMKPY